MGDWGICKTISISGGVTNYIKEPKNWTKQNKLGLIWDVVLDNVRLELNKLNDKIASKNNNEKRKQLIGG